MNHPSRLRAAVVLGAVTFAAAGLGGCQSIGNVLGGGSGVMPDSDLGPPPSMRDAVKGSRPMRTSSVDEDGVPLPATPTRRLDLPKSVGGSARTAEAEARRISRDEIDGNASGGRGSGGFSPAPSLTPGGGVGMGGKF